MTAMTTMTGSAELWPERPGVEGVDGFDAVAWADRQRQLEDPQVSMFRSLMADIEAVQRGEDPFALPGEEPIDYRRALSAEETRELEDHMRAVLEGSSRW